MELVYDSKLYRPATIPVRLRRHITSGLTESVEPTWSWSVNTPHGEGAKKVTAAARASGFFTPPLIRSGSGSKFKNATLGKFFSPRSSSPAMSTLEPGCTTPTAAAAATSAPAETPPPPEMTGSHIPCANAVAISCHDMPSLLCHPVPGPPPSCPIPTSATPFPSGAASSGAATNGSTESAFATPMQTPPSSAAGAPTETTPSAEMTETLQPMQIAIDTPAGAMVAALRDAGRDLNSLGAIRNCPGHQLSLPPGHITRHYPYAAHESSSTYPWSVPNEAAAVFARQGVLGTRSYSACKRFVVMQIDDMQVEAPSPCTPCQMLSGIKELAALEECAESDAPHIKLPNYRLSAAQMSNKSKRQREVSSMQRLREWHLSRKLNRIQSARETHHKIIELLACNKVARVQQLFGQMVAQGASPAKILTTVELAIAGRYKPKGFDADDHDDTMLVRIMGGARLLYAMQQSHSLMSDSCANHCAA